MLQESQAGDGRFRRAALLIAVMAVALAVRLYSAKHASNIAADGTTYLSMARQFTQEPPLAVAQTYQYHPAYSAVVAAIAGPLNLDWPNGWITAARWVSIAASLLALAMVYLFASRMFDRNIALVTVLFLALSWPMIETCSDVLSDSFAVAMALAAIVAGLRCEQAARQQRWSAVALAAVAGLLAGIGYLTRPEELIAAGIAAMLLLRARPATRRQRAIQGTALAALLAATLICVLPYALTIGGLTQKKSFSDFVIAGGDRAVLAQATWTPQLLEAMRRVIDRYRSSIGTPITILGLVCWTTWLGRYVFRLRLPDRVVIKPSAGPLMAMATVLVVLGALLTMLEYNQLHLQADGQWSKRYVSDRHGMLPGLLFAPTAGAGLMILVQWTLIFARAAGKRLAMIVISGSRAAQTIAAVPIKLLTERPQVAMYLWLAVFIVALSSNALRAPHADKECYRQAGLEILRHFGPGHAVLADNRWTPFFAGSPLVQFQKDSRQPCSIDVQELAPDRLVNAALRGGYEFLELSISPTDPPDKAVLLAAVKADGRFEQFGTPPRSAKARDKTPRFQEAWIFRVRNSPATLPTTQPE